MALGDITLCLIPTTLQQDKVELDMLRQKCDAWREEAEKLAPLRGEVGRLHTHASALQEEIKFLKADNEQLGKQLQSVTEERDRIQTETYRKAPPDYDNLRDRLTELQQVCVQLESELIPLREERTVVLMENARLREGAQLRELEKELSEVKDQNAALQSQLQEYVGVISDQSEVGTQHAYVPTTLCTLMCCHSTYTTPLPSFPSPFN